MGKLKFDMKSIVFIGVLILITVLLFIRDIDGKLIDKFVFLGVGVIYALIADYRHLLMFISFIFPLTNGLPGNYLMPVLCFLLILKGYRRTDNPRLIWIAFFLIAISELLHMLVLSTTPGLPDYIGYISAIYFLLYIGGSNDKNADNANNAFCFCIGACVMMGIIMLNFNTLLDNTLETGVRIGDISKYSDTTEMTLRTNANNIALYSITTISLSLALWYYKKISIWLLAPLSIVAFLAGVNSFSRSWILAFLLVVFLYLIFSEKKSIRTYFFVVLAGIGVYLFVTGYGSAVFPIFAERFQEDEASSAGLRTVHFIEYHNWMMSHIWATLMGVGALTYKEVTGIWASSHNAFQQIFLAYGLPGFVFFIYLFVRCIKKWFVRKEKFYYLPLIVVIFFLQSLQFLNPAYCMFPLIATFFILKMVKQDHKSLLIICQSGLKSK